MKRQTCITGIAVVFMPIAPAALGEEALPLWEAGVGVGGSFSTDYPASGEQSFNAVPFPMLYYRGDFLRIGDDSLVAGRLIKNDRFEFDISASGSFSADSKDIEVRAGMPDLDYLFEVGPELEINLRRDERGELKLELPARAVFSTDLGNLRSRGWVFNPELEYERQGFMGRDAELSVGVAPVFASEDLMDYFYQVAPEFARPGRAAYDGKAGYLGTEIGVRLELREDQRRIYLGARVVSHHGARNDSSPLFEQDWSFSIYAAIVWTPWRSKQSEAD